MMCGFYLSFYIYGGPNFRILITHVCSTFRVLTISTRRVRAWMVGILRRARALSLRIGEQIRIKIKRSERPLSEMAPTFI